MVENREAKKDYSIERFYVSSASPNCQNDCIIQMSMQVPDPRVEVDLKNFDEEGLSSVTRLETSV